MKAFSRLFSTFSLSACIFLSSLATLSADVPSPLPSSQTLQIRILNFKTCVEQSKMGKEEQASFENLRKQMDAVLDEKEKARTELASKLNDPDYLDSLSPEAETELKRKFRALTQELSQQESQYYQTLNQTNMKAVQKLTEAATQASKLVAKRNKIDLVLAEESAFFYAPELDISQEVIREMDAAKATTDRKSP